MLDENKAFVLWIIGRNCLFPDVVEKYVPEVLYNCDVEMLTLLLTKTPEQMAAHLSKLEKPFGCRALFDQWAWRLATRWPRTLPPHIMQRMASAGA